LGRKGRDSQFGFGLVDPYRALSALEPKVAADHPAPPVAAPAQTKPLAADTKPLAAATPPATFAVSQLAPGAAPTAAPRSADADDTRASVEKKRFACRQEGMNKGMRGPDLQDYVVVCLAEARRSRKKSMARNAETSSTVAWDRSAAFACNDRTVNRHSPPKIGAGALALISAARAPGRVGAIPAPGGGPVGRPGEWIGLAKSAKAAHCGHAFLRGGKAAIGTAQPIGPAPAPGIGRGRGQRHADERDRDKNDRSHDCLLGRQTALRVRAHA